MFEVFRFILSFSGCLIVPLSAVFILAGALLLWNSLAVFEVRSQSMSPALLDGDRVLILRHWPGSWLTRGRIVVVSLGPEPRKGESARDAEHRTYYIKRITGLPGDTVTTSLSDLAEFLRPSQAPQYGSAGLRNWLIPAGHIFVQSTRLPAAADSLVWGPLPMYNVYGVVLKRLHRNTST